VKYKIKEEQKREGSTPIFYPSWLSLGFPALTPGTASSALPLAVIPQYCAEHGFGWVYRKTGASWVWTRIGDAELFPAGAKFSPGIQIPMHWAPHRTEAFS
jgi:hypothetical protein